MAIFLSDLMGQGSPLVLRGSHAGERCEVTARVVIPSGTTLTDGDLIKIARVPSGFRLDEVILRSDGDLDPGTDSLTADLGYLRALSDPSLAYNASTNAAVSGSVSADDENFWVSGIGTGFTQADAAAVIRYVAGDLGTTNELATIAEVDGYADVVIDVTASANAAVAADRTIDVTLRYVGEQSTPGSLSYNYDPAY